MTDWERTMCTWYVADEVDWAYDEPLCDPGEEEEVSMNWALAMQMSGQGTAQATPAVAAQTVTKPTDVKSWNEGHAAGVKSAARSLLDYLEGKDAVATEQAVWEWLRDHDVASAIIKEVWRRQ